MSQRYIRQTSLAGFGPGAQEALSQAHVAVIGAGGLGSPALLYLAGAGVGRITVIDDDVVSLSNLHRQVIHPTAAVGTSKAESAAAQMRALNPDIEVVPLSTRLSQDNALELLAADAVLDGSDNFGTRYLASWACATLGIPHVWGSILGFDAQMTVFHAGEGPIYEDLFPTPPAPGSVPSCAQAGVLGPVVGAVGSAMALEAIKLITGVGTPLRGTLGYYSALEGTWEYVPLSAGAGTVDRVLGSGPLAAEDAEPSVPEVDAIPAGALVLDVREDEERAAGFIPGSAHVPLGRILDGYTPQLDAGDVVIYCAGGVRSARAVEALSARPETADTTFYSLRGGFDNWTG